MGSYKVTQKFMGLCTFIQGGDYRSSVWLVFLKLVNFQVPSISFSISFEEFLVEFA